MGLDKRRIRIKASGKDDVQNGYPWILAVQSSGFQTTEVLLTDNDVLALAKAALKGAENVIAKLQGEGEEPEDGDDDGKEV